MSEEEEGDHEEGEDDRGVLRETIHLLQKSEHQRQFLEWAGFNLAILTSRANLRISTEVSDSWGMVDSIIWFEAISERLMVLTLLGVPASSSRRERKGACSEESGQEFLPCVTQVLPLVFLKGIFWPLLEKEPGGVHQTGSDRERWKWCETKLELYHVVERAGCIEQVKRKSCDQVREEPPLEIGFVGLWNPPLM